MTLFLFIFLFYFFKEINSMKQEINKTIQIQLHDTMEREMANFKQDVTASFNKSENIQIGL